MKQRIVLTESDLHRLIKESVKEVLRESNYTDDGDHLIEAIDPGTLNDILERYGWYYSGWEDVTNSKGEEAVAYKVYPHSSHSADITRVVEAIKNVSEDPSCIVLGGGNHKYDPNKSINIIYVKMTTPSPQMELPFEN